MSYGQRVLRNYRIMAPSNFHRSNQRIAANLGDKSKIAERVWASNPGLITNYLATSARHDTFYHQAQLGSKVDIAQRDALQAQLVIFLDEIAAILELAAVYDPNILIVSGFDLAKERRGHPRIKSAAAAAHAAHAADGEGQSGS
ncbi:hypothetical protein GMLC_36300 [Geomonas limicola]|uniref:Uncharacterized protein n=1 Tax=Geomonas limicola TaxID=2740186 RepID=A0A6V8NC05_9BACT|nr:hypothetical protein [Geomonas limicola]GFO70051.1 hypothetical protein GMLC_36300 [Geomonas limicola]